MLHTFLGASMYLKASFCQVNRKKFFFDCFQVDDDTEEKVKYFILKRGLCY